MHVDPRLARVLDDVVGSRREPEAKLTALTRWCSRIPRDFPSAASSTTGGHYGDFSGFDWGGDEAFIIEKGSPWPQELARVLATLFQFAGFAARLLFLYREEPPALHTAVEVWNRGSWAVFDPVANRCYPWPHHGYASALNLQQQPRLIDQCPEHGRIESVDSAFYRTVAIAGYPLLARDGFSYAAQPARPDDLPRLRRAVALLQAR